MAYQKSFWFKRYIISCFAFFFGHSVLYACEKYEKISKEDALKFDQILNDTANKPIERIFAFRELICSDIPSLRKSTIDFGLISKISEIRSEAFSALLMEKSEFNFSLNDSKDLNISAQQNLKAHGSVLNGTNFGKNKEKNCINLRPGNGSCDKDVNYSISIIGTRFSLKIHNISGEFTLQPDGKILGFLRFSTSDTPIPARLLN